MYAAGFVRGFEVEDRMFRIGDLEFYSAKRTDTQC